MKKGVVLVVNGGSGFVVALDGGCGVSCDAVLRRDFLEGVGSASVVSVSWCFRFLETFSPLASRWLFLCFLDGVGVGSDMV